MTRVEWPARMQRLSHGRLAALLPAESELWLDGGHNADGGQAIAAALADLEERVSRPLVLIVGMLATKDSAGFLKNFSGLARRVITVPIHQDKTVPAAELAEIAGSVGIPALPRDDVAECDCAGGQARFATGAAHSHYRLALPCRRGLGGQRHAAGMIIKS